MRMNGNSSEKEKALWSVWCDEELKTPEKVVMTMLILYADDHNCQAWPSVGPLHDMSGYDNGNIVMMIKRLVKLHRLSEVEEGRWKIEILKPEQQEENPYKHFRPVDNESTIRVKPGQWIMPKETMYANLPPSNAELTRDERERKMNARYRKGGNKT